MSTEPSPRIPLVVGVVGHIDLSDRTKEAVAATVRDVLKKLRKQFPDSPIEVLSGLAPGADQTAVRAALDLNDPEITVRAPLPFPVEVYLKSSSFPPPPEGTVSPEQAAVREWTGAGGRVSSFVVAGGPAPGAAEAWQRACDDPASRHERYARAGEYIVRHSLLLIAAWDGGKGKAAGTGEMVRYKLSGRVPAALGGRSGFEIDAETGPVYVIRAPKVGADGTAGGLTVLAPEATGHAHPAGESDDQVPPEEVFRRVSGWRRFGRRVGAALGYGSGTDAVARYANFLEGVHNLDAYNRDVRRGGTALGAKVADGTGQLLRREEKGAAGAERTPADRDRWVPLGGAESFRRLAAVRTAAAELANRLEWRLKWLHRLLFGFFFLAIFFLHLYSHWLSPGGDHTPLWLALYVALLLASAGLVAATWYRRVDLRRLDYRALAEAIRVRCFWGLVGIDRSVADEYLRHLRSEMAWARRALQMISPPPAEWGRLFEARGEIDRAECVACAAERWVTEQKQYFEKSHEGMHQRAKWLRRLGLALAVAGWAIAVGLLVAWAGAAPAGSAPPPIPPAEAAMGLIAAGPAGAPGAPLDPRHPPAALVILSALLVIGGALLIAYCERRAHEPLARQYGSMWAVCAHAEAQLAAALGRTPDDWARPGAAPPDLAAARAVLEALGREALVEHVNWLSIRRARPVELVMG